MSERIYSFRRIPAGGAPAGKVRVRAPGVLAAFERVRRQRPEYAQDQIIFTHCEPAEEQHP